MDIHFPISLLTVAWVAVVARVGWYIGDFLVGQFEHLLYRVFHWIKPGSP